MSRLCGNRVGRDILRLARFGLAIAIAIANEHMVKVGSFGWHVGFENILWLKAD
jgi:hypothetical protein